MSTTTIDTAATGTEWGVRLTWPDGHTETVDHKSRSDAELHVRCVNRSDTNPATAVLVARNPGEWVEMQS